MWDDSGSREFLLRYSRRLWVHSVSWLVFLVFRWKFTSLLYRARLVWCWYRDCADQKWLAVFAMFFKTFCFFTPCSWMKRRRAVHKDHLTKKPVNHLLANYRLIYAINRQVIWIGIISLDQPRTLPPSRHIFRPGAGKHWYSQALRPTWHHYGFGCTSQNRSK